MARLISTLIGLQILGTAIFCLIVSILWPKVANYQEAPKLGGMAGEVGSTLLILGIIVLLTYPILIQLGKAWPQTSEEQDSEKIKQQYLKAQRTPLPKQKVSRAVRWSLNRGRFGGRGGDYSTSTSHQFLDNSRNREI